MKKNGLYIYGAIVAMVAGYAVYDNWATERADKQKLESSKISSFDKDQVSALKLKLKTDTVELEKTVDGWKMLAPYKDQANNAVIEEFIDGIVSERSSGIAADANVDFKTYGLDEPKAKIELSNNQGHKQMIQIGSVKNFQGDSYLRLNDEQKVIIASSTWQTKAEKTAMEFRDRRLMRLSNAKTDKISIKSVEGRFNLEKIDSQWTIPGHKDWKLDQNKVRELLNKLNITEAIEFIADGKPTSVELKKWGFDGKNEISFETFSEGKTTWSAKIVTGDDKVTRAIISSPQFILKMSPQEISGFKLAAAYYRDRTEPFQFNKEKAKKIHLQLGSQKYDLDATEERAKELLAELQKLELDRFEDQLPANLENMLEIVDNDGKQIFKFQWSKAIDVSDEKSSRNTVFAKSSSYSGNFSLLESEINSLKLEDLKSDVKTGK